MKDDTLPKTVEEIVIEFEKAYEGILPPEEIKKGSDWYRSKLTALLQGIVGEIEAKLHTEKELDSMQHNEQHASLCLKCSFEHENIANRKAAQIIKKYYE